VASNGNGNANKKLLEDTKRAQRAIDALSRWSPDAWDKRSLGKNVNLAFDAVEAEIARLYDAVANPEKLWRIYRRADKGASYASHD